MLLDLAVHGIEVAAIVVVIVVKAFPAVVVAQRFHRKLFLVYGRTKGLGITMASKVLKVLLLPPVPRHPFSPAWEVSLHSDGNVHRRRLTLPFFTVARRLFEEAEELEDRLPRIRLPFFLVEEKRNTIFQFLREGDSFFAFLWDRLATATTLRLSVLAPTIRTKVTSVCVLKRVSMYTYVSCEKISDKRRARVSRCGVAVEK